MNIHRKGKRGMRSAAGPGRLALLLLSQTDVAIAVQQGDLVVAVALRRQDLISTV